MRSKNLSLVVLAGALAVIPVIACTTTIVDPVPAEEEDASTGGFDSGNKVDAASDKKDATADARVDSGRDVSQPPVDAARDVNVADANDGGSSSAPATGSACSTPGVEYTKKCGFCGTATAVCEADRKVGEYGFCQGQVADGCMPGDTRMSNCGLCGKKTEICQANCQWAAGSCMGEPANACSPGAIKYTTAGCSMMDTFRKQTCNAMCQFDVPEPPPCKPKDTFVTISNTVNATVSFSGELSPLTMQIARLSTGNCPTTLSTTNTSFAWTELRNTDAVPHKVEVYYDAPAGGTDIDTITAAYDGNTIPADRLTCTGVVNDFCSTSPCTSSWSGLVGTNGPTIPAGSSIMIYTAAWSSSVTGKFELFAKTVN